MNPASKSESKPKTSLHSVPLAVRLAALATVILALALLVGGVAFRNALRTQQSNELAEAAKQRVDTLVEFVESGNIPARLPSARDSPLFAQIVNPAAKVVAATTNVDDMKVMVDLSKWKPVSTLVSGRTQIDRASCLVFVQGVETSSGRFAVIVAAPLRASEETMTTLLNQMVAIAPLVLVFSALLFWVLARRALRPVETLRSEVDAISANELHRRVSAPSANDEIGRLARTMNSLLARIDESNMRQARFVSDASHELRSPLAALRTRVEVGLRNPENTDWTAVARGVLNDSSRMERLTTNLLFLARNDGTPTTAFADVDLDDIVLDEIATLRMRTDIVLSSSGVSGGRVCGDADELRRVVINLLDNAVRFAKTNVACVVKMTETGVTFEVRDDGPGIPPDQRERIFERFTRVDEDRSRASGGAGLGLAIVADILRAHKATVSVLDAEPHGTVMRVEFPPAM